MSNTILTGAQSLHCESKPGRSSQLEAAASAAIHSNRAMRRVFTGLKMVIAIFWSTLFGFVLCHMAACCTKLLCAVLFDVDLRGEDYLVLVTVWMSSLILQCLLAFPWPARIDDLRILLRGVVAIPTIVQAAVIVCGVLMYLCIVVAG